jgi:hypothetical protein
MRAVAAATRRGTASIGPCPGASSGRQRKQARKPAASAAAALAKKPQRSRRGVRAGHTGRQ